MNGEVKIAAIGNPFEFTELSRGKSKTIFNIDRALRIVRKLFFRVLEESQVLRLDSEVGVPAVSLINPVLVPFFVRSWIDEELHLHLLKLARAENEVSRCDFVAERFTDLPNSERRFLPCSAGNVGKVDEDSLGRFGAQIVHSLFVRDGAEVRLEKAGELLGFRPLSAISAEATGNLSQATFRGAALLLSELLFEVVRAKALVARQALDERVAEHIDVPGRFPHLAGKNDRGIKADDIRPTLHHGLPPLALDVFFEFHTEGPVIPR